MARELAMSACWGDCHCFLRGVSFHAHHYHFRKVCNKFPFYILINITNTVTS